MMSRLAQFNLILFSFILISCGTGAQKNADTQGEQTAEVLNLSVPQFEKMRLAGAGVVIIDVRTPEEIAKGKVPNALEIDYQADDFEQKIEALDSETTYVMYCEAGGRGSKASKLMVQKGFKNVYNLEGGYEAWAKAVSK